MKTKQQSKKYSCISVLQDNEKGIVLIIALVLIAVLAIVSTVALITTTTDIKISANYRDGIKAFSIADAGIERAKSEMRTASFNDVLNGTIGGSPGFLSFGTNTSFAGGTYSVTVTDDDEDGDGIPCPDDADDDCLQNSNGKVIVTSVGSLPRGSKRRIEVVVSQLPVDGLPSAIVFVDNGNGVDEEDKIILGSGTNIDPIADNDSTVGSLVKDVFITGDDTLDNSTTAGDGPGPDAIGVASQESFRVQGGPQDPAVLEQVGFFNERLYNSLDPNFIRPVIDGGSAPSWGEGVGIGGPSESQLKSQVATLFNKYDNFIGSSQQKLSQTSFTDFGTSSDPEITYCEGDFLIDGTISGYGIFIVNGDFEVKDGDFEFHGLIYIVCRGQLKINSTDAVLNLWGGITNITYDEPGCTSIAAEERLGVQKGTLHIYYSTDAIKKHALPLTFEVDSWRELY